MKKLVTYCALVSFLTCWVCPIFADDWHAVSYEDVTLPNEEIVLSIMDTFGVMPKALDHWRIDSENDFRAFLESMSTDGHELGYTLIDFSKKTLLSQYTSGGPGAFFEKIITRNDSLKKVKMEVRIGSDGKVYNASRSSYSLNLVLVPKIPADYEVNFISEKEKIDGGVTFVSFD